MYIAHVPNFPPPFLSFPFSKTLRLLPLLHFPPNFLHSWHSYYLLTTATRFSLCLTLLHRRYTFDVIFAMRSISNIAGLNERSSRIPFRRTDMIDKAGKPSDVVRIVPVRFNRTFVFILFLRSRVLQCSLHALWKCACDFLIFFS